MIGQQKTLHTRMKAVSVLEQASQPFKTDAAAMRRISQDFADRRKRSNEGRRRMILKVTVN